MIDAGAGSSPDPDVTPATAALVAKVVLNTAVDLISAMVGASVTVLIETIDAAFQLRLDDKIGTIEVGKRADLIVLDRNLFELAPADISSANIVMTLMDGVIRHEQR